MSPQKSGLPPDHQIKLVGNKLDKRNLIVTRVGNGSKKREPWPPLRDEKAISKVHKLHLEGTKIIDYCLSNPTVEGA